jgi:hypothetical protein
MDMAITPCREGCKATEEVVMGAASRGARVMVEEG